MSQTLVPYQPPKPRGGNKTVTILPGTGHAIRLGVFSSSQPEPQFEMDFAPNISDEIGVSRTHLEAADRATYILLYMFQNFSGQTCKINIRRASARSANRGR